MKITEIKQARKHFFNIVFEEESVLLDKETVVKNGLKVGQEIDSERLEELKYDSEYTRAVSKAMWLLSRREYSKKEMFLRLKKDGFDADASSEAVESLSEAGVIDDERFAYNYAYNLKANRRLGKRAIITELLLKGVDRSLAERFAEEFCDDETDDAVDIIRIKYPSFAEDEKVKRRMIAGLQRKGYSYDVIKTAIDKYLTE